jgi:hypothetical protein
MGFRTKYGSLGFGWEASYATVAAAFQYVPAEFEQPELGRVTQDMNRYAQQFGGNQPPIVGGKDSSGTVTFNMSLEAFVKTYDPVIAGNQPGDAGVIGSVPVLLGMATGSGNASIVNHATMIAGAGLSLTASVIGDVAGVPAPTTIPYTGGTWAEGQYVIAGDAATDYQTGWPYLDAGNVLTLDNAAQNTAIAGEDIYGTAVAYLNNSEHPPITLRWTGEGASFAVDFLGCKNISGFIDVQSGQVPTVSLTYEYSGYDFPGVGGEIQAPSLFAEVPALGSKDAGRLLVDGVSAALRDFRLEWDSPAHKEQNHNMPYGFDRKVGDRMFSMTFGSRWIAADVIALGENPWSTRFVNGTQVSVEMEIGDTLGRFFAMRAPQWVVAEQTQLEDGDLMQYNTVKLIPNYYEGDNGTTAPANVPLALAWG